MEPAIKALEGVIRSKKDVLALLDRDDIANLTEESVKEQIRREFGREISELEMAIGVLKSVPVIVDMEED